MANEKVQCEPFEFPFNARHFRCAIDAALLMRALPIINKCAVFAMAAREDGGAFYGAAASASSRRRKDLGVRYNVTASQRYNWPRSYSRRKRPLRPGAVAEETPRRPKGERCPIQTRAQ